MYQHDSRHGQEQAYLLPMYQHDSRYGQVRAFLPMTARHRQEYLPRYELQEPTLGYLPSFVEEREPERCPNYWGLEAAMIPTHQNDLTPQEQPQAYFPRLQ
jgi:hypothetical protein